MPFHNRRLQIALVIEIALLALAATFIIPSTGGLLPAGETIEW